MGDKKLLTLDILQQYGGVEANTLEKIVGSFSDDDDEIDITKHSYYYSPYELPAFVNDEKLTDIKILSLNSESLNAKFPQLQILISIWAEKGIFFDIICLQETWIKAGADTSSSQLNGYNMINQFCCCSDHGGLLIYVLSDFKIKILKKLLSLTHGKVYL